MFSKEIVNTGRQKELDIQKTIVIVFMIFCHVGIYFVDIETTLGIIDEVLVWVSTGNMYLDAIFGLIWGTQGNTYFPILNWMIFPCFGVLFGELLQHCNDKERLYKNIFINKNKKSINLCFFI